MYLSTLMLTGQGGPSGDLPWYTKGVVLLTGAFSIGMFAIPASMLTWGFEAEAERCAKRARAMSRRNNDANNNATSETNDNDDDDNWSDSTLDYSTDEEYQKIIAGEDSEDDDDDDDDDHGNIAMKHLLAKFAAADADGSGNISLQEFISLVQQQQQQQQQNATNAVQIQGMGFVGGAAVRHDQQFQTRLSALEERVRNNSDKLDRLVNLLENIDRKMK
eukprot:CAMPEP_0198112148 /NCGR_PEP_ID=MMETSP1442-20131203/4046_1 /TAXON_ID= /ORGANISM="Craspedostauros australis, Strain CCMP3328" /LENGTH=218 /DNA_ID=CAMNT_0043768833 /DNA_START=11 /DNA_END=667 /DNA_ORIENTATION=+